MADIEKITQSLTFILDKCGGSLDRLKVIKIIYLADRYCYRKYGYTITDDGYAILPYGVAPSVITDITSTSQRSLLDYKASGVDEDDLNYFNDHVKIEAVGKQSMDEILHLNKLNISFLEDTDIESINFAFQFINIDTQILINDVIHNLPEWEEGKIGEPISLKEFLKDPTIDGVPICYKMSDKEKLIASTY